MVKKSACNVGDPGFDPWVGKISWRSYIKVMVLSFFFFFFLMRGKGIACARFSTMPKLFLKKKGDLFKEKYSKTLEHHLIKSCFKRTQTTL